MLDSLVNNLVTGCLFLYHSPTDTRCNWKAWRNRFDDMFTNKKSLSSSSPFNTRRNTPPRNPFLSLWAMFPPPTLVAWDKSWSSSSSSSSSPLMIDHTHSLFETMRVLYKLIWPISNKWIYLIMKGYQWSESSWTYPSRKKAVSSGHYISFYKVERDSITWSIHEGDTPSPSFSLTHKSVRGEE